MSSTYSDYSDYDLMIHSMNGIQEVHPHIFISSEGTAENEDLLKSNNIKAILRVTCDSASGDIQKRYGLMGIDYYQIYMLDQPCFDISKYFEITKKIIKTYCRNGENILVHCGAGISRSPTIVAAYLLTEKNLSVDQIILYMQAKRPIIDPNDGFIRQLKDVFENV